MILRVRTADNFTIGVRRCKLYRVWQNLAQGGKMGRGCNKDVKGWEVPVTR